MSTQEKSMIPVEVYFVPCTFGNGWNAILKGKSSRICHEMGRGSMIWATKAQALIDLTRLMGHPVVEWERAASQECKGHPAGTVGAGGETEFCDGSCRRVIMKKFQGFSRREGALKYQARICVSEPLRSEAPIVRMGDGSWAVKVVIPWMAVATIPMPERLSPHTYLYGTRGSWCEI